MKLPVLGTLAVLAIACTGDAPPDLARDPAAPERDHVAEGVASAAEAVQGVCERTPQIRNEIVRVTGAATCDVVTSQDLAGISTLDLGGTGIEALREGDFAGLLNLSSLDLGDNDLAALPEGVFAALANLQELRLSRNDLTTLSERTFAGLSSLQSLGLYGNNLTAVPEGVFAGLTSLESLDLAGNGLTVLPGGVFSGLTNLQSLRLSDNGLRTLPEEMFAELSSLKSLDLSQNGLVELPVGVFAGLSSLQSVHVENNPGSPFELALGRTDSWCTVQQAAYINFQLQNGKTVSICEDEGVLTYFFGHLDAEPELRYSGRILARLGGPAVLPTVDLFNGENVNLADLAGWTDDPAERELLEELAGATGTNGFVAISGYTGSFSSSLYVFRNGGWQYEIGGVWGRTFNYPEGTEEYEKLATYAEYQLTLRSPDGQVYRFEKTVGESPFVG